MELGTLAGWHSALAAGWGLPAEPGERPAGSALESPWEKLTFLWLSQSEVRTADPEGGPTVRPQGGGAEASPPDPPSRQVHQELEMHKLEDSCCVQPEPVSSGLQGPGRQCAGGHPQTGLREGLMPMCRRRYPGLHWRDSCLERWSAILQEAEQSRNTCHLGKVNPSEGKLD